MKLPVEFRQPVVIWRARRDLPVEGFDICQYTENAPAGSLG
jgi:hypothetical protein